MNPQKGNLYLIIAIIVGVVAIGATGFASWKYFGGGSELEKNGDEITKPLIKKETEKSETIDKKADLSSKASATEDWKSYRNNEYEIKYPSNWNFYEEKNAYWDQNAIIVTFCGPEYQGDCRMAGKGSNAAIVLRNDSLDIEKENFCQDNPLNIFCDEKILSRENIKVGKKEGKIFNINVNGNSLYVLWKKNLSDKKMYEISADELRNFPQHQNIFNQMLSTFRFIETDETANWKVYQNKEYGFEVKYPREAKYSKPTKAKGIVFIGKIGEISTSGFGYGITVDVIKNPQNLSAENWYTQYYKNKKEESKNIPFFLSPKGEHTKLNIYSAYKTADFGVDHTDIYYFVSRNSYIYKVHYDEEKTNDPNWNQHESIINQIVSTFKFTKADETTSVKILSPNGGEKWKIGNNYLIRWNSVGSIPQVKIYLVPVDSNRGIRDISYGPIANTGLYTYAIPYCGPGHECSSNFEIPKGKYYIRITDSEGVISDQSDASFSIVSN